MFSRDFLFPFLQFSASRGAGGECELKMWYYAPYMTPKEIKIDGRMMNQIGMGIEVFANSPEFKQFEYASGLLKTSDRMRSDFLAGAEKMFGEDGIPSGDRAEVFANRARELSILIGKKLYDLIKIAAAGQEGAKCESCGQGVCSENHNTPLSKLGRLNEVGNDPQPELFWKDEYTLECGHCGAPSDVDIQPVVSLIGAEYLGISVRHAYGFQENLRIRDILNNVFEPFRRGKVGMITEFNEKLSQLK